MAFIKKHKQLLALSVLFVLLFIGSRFYNILAVPIFTDEAIYIRWAQIAKQDAAWRFISLTDGKQPLFIWLIMIIMRFIDDPLLAGRTISIFAGLGSMVGLFFLTGELFKNRSIGLIAAGLYVLYPFALVYDRMALYDSLVGTFAIWSLYFAVLLARRVRFDLALILGMVLGGGVLNKTSGFISAASLPFSILLFRSWDKRRIVRWVLFIAVAVVFMYLYYSILRLSPFFHIIDEKNTIFYYPFSEWIKHPFQEFLSNWKGLFNWFITYVTWPIFFLMVSAFFLGKAFLREKLLLFLWFFFPFVVLAFIGKTLYPRFIFFMTLSLLPLAALSFHEIPRLIGKPFFFVPRTLAIVIYALVFFFLQLRIDYFILTDLARSPVPRSDLDQYINEWPAGGGIKEAVAFFEREAKNGPIYVGTQGSFGLLPYALEIYLNQNPNVKIVGFWPVDNTPPTEVIEQSHEMPTYFVFYQPCASCEKNGFAPPTWPVSLIAQYHKGLGQSYLSIYQMHP